MSLSVFMNALKNKGILISSTTTPELAEVLLPLFDNDNSHVQMLSMHLFCKVMELVVEKGKKPLKTIVCQILPPLLFHCHDENQRVAEASHKTLLCAAEFLKRRNLKQLVKTEKTLKFAKCLCCTQRCQPEPHTLLPSLGCAGSSPPSSGAEPGADGALAQLGCGAGRHRSSPGSTRPSALSRARRQRLLAGSRGCAGRGGQGRAKGAPGQGAEPAPTLPSWHSLQLAEDRSQAAEHLRRALPYLYSPQEPLREAAVRFIGIAGVLMLGQKEELQVLSEALQALRRDNSPSQTNIVVQQIVNKRAAELCSSAGSEEPESL
ncbi:uncharacterized protein LOC120410322 [Corvus cornix cornix]|uniref:uncharacterized protein LOC120410322 n=1 Tax=Corvus cornix cornix TaxID=932674 RepID=UPI00194FA942|nr:uncharacterized protein LOC120410322 [Corvus cornix cornix]